MHRQLSEADRLSAEAPRVVILCGVSGSGKTTLARKLAAQGRVIVSLDHIIWERYGARYASLPPDEQHEIFLSLGVELDRRVCEAVGRGERVVVDAAMCKRRGRDRLRAACLAAGADVSLIWLTASPATLTARLDGRKGQSPDDAIVEPDRLRGFLAGFERPDDDEDAVTICTDAAGKAADCGPQTDT